MLVKPGNSERDSAETNRKSRIPRISTFADPSGERVHSAAVLMADMLAERPAGTELDFRRIQHAALAGALVLSASAIPPAWCVGDYLP
jgi:hypothetical protein